MRKIRQLNYGFSLIELLVVLVIISILTAVFVSAYSVYQKYRLNNASRTGLEQLAGALTANLLEDIQTAGLGLKDKGPNSGLVVNDLSINQPRPAVFIGSEGTILTILSTDHSGVGDILVRPGISDTKLVIVGVDFKKWLSLKPGNLVMCVNKIGPPALVRLESIPRKATPIDVPKGEDEVLNLERVVVIEISHNPICTDISSLTKTVMSHSLAVPVTRVVRYFKDEKGITRQEIEGCAVNGAEGIMQESQIPMTPFISSDIKFSYVTSGGITAAFPVDPQILRGIQVQASLTDPTTKLSKGIIFESYVSAWK